MKKSYRNAIVVTVTFLAGLYFFLEWLLPEAAGDYIRPGSLTHEEISTALILTGVTAIGLGLINLVRVHGSVIIKNRKGSLNSFALLLGAFSVFVIEGADFLTSIEQSEETQRLNQLEEYKNKHQDNPEKLALLTNEVDRILELTRDSNSLYYSTDQNYLSLLQGSKAQLESQNYDAPFPEILAASREVWTANMESYTAKVASDFVFEALFVPLGSAMFSLLAFYVATAAYRTFRINSWETSLMMIGAVLVILGQIPLGPLYIHEDLPQVRFKLMQYISTPASRAILFGSLIAGLAMSLRMWLSLERSPLSTEGNE